jgi:hypothetical protein
VVDFDGPLPPYAHLMISLLTVVMKLTPMAAGCFLFCTRDAYAATGGFDERLFGAEEIAMSLAIRRHGRFVVLGQRVITSGRKLRAYTPREVFTTLGQLFRGGVPALRSREALAMWYQPRRHDPADETIGRAA